jgi:hypothetical protein
LLDMIQSCCVTYITLIQWGPCLKTWHTVGHYGTTHRIKIDLERFYSRLPPTKTCWLQWPGILTFQSYDFLMFAAILTPFIVLTHLNEFLKMSYMQQNANTQD